MMIYMICSTEKPVRENFLIQNLYHGMSMKDGLKKIKGFAYNLYGMLSEQR
jgi:hypothetical protein